MIERFGDPFRPLEPDCSVLQFDQPLSELQLRQAGRLIASRPDVELYVYGRASKDLNFLEHFSDVERLHVALYDLEDISGIGHLQRLRAFTFGETRRKFSLRVLQSFSGLEHLFLVHHATDLDVLQHMRSLRSLGLSGLTLPDLAWLTSFASLRKLSILLGGTRNLDALADLPVLDELFLVRITKLACRAT